MEKLVLEKQLLKQRFYTNTFQAGIMPLTLIDNNPSSSTPPTFVRNGCRLIIQPACGLDGLLIDYDLPEIPVVRLTGIGVGDPTRDGGEEPRMRSSR